MFEDLINPAWEDAYLKNSAIAALAGEENPEGIAFGGEYDVDDKKIREKVPCTVLEADASQICAIADALDGQNMVLEGPPGTGKSQTIANTIAALMAQGKRVLFVSEKRAALEVVKKRLDEVGLGDFCLELHSTRSKKLEVYKELGRRAKLGRKTPVSFTETALNLTNAFDRMNERSKRLETCDLEHGNSLEKRIWTFLVKEGSKSWLTSLRKMPVLPFASEESLRKTWTEFSKVIKELKSTPINTGNSGLLRLLRSGIDENSIPESITMAAETVQNMSTFWAITCEVVFLKESPEAILADVLGLVSLLEANSYFIQADLRLATLFDRKSLGAAELALKGLETSLYHRNQIETKFGVSDKVALKGASPWSLRRHMSRLGSLGLEDHIFSYVSHEMFESRQRVERLGRALDLGKEILVASGGNDSATVADLGVFIRGLLLSDEANLLPLAENLNFKDLSLPGTLEYLEAFSRDCKVYAEMENRTGSYIRGGINSKREDLVEAMGVLRARKHFWWLSKKGRWAAGVAKNALLIDAWPASAATINALRDCLDLAELKLKTEKAKNKIEPLLGARWDGVSTDTEVPMLWADWANRVRSQLNVKGSLGKKLADELLGHASLGASIFSKAAEMAQKWSASDWDILEFGDPGSPIKDFYQKQRDRLSQIEELHVDLESIQTPGSFALNELGELARDLDGVFLAEASLEEWKKVESSSNLPVVTTDELQVFAAQIKYSKMVHSLAMSAATTSTCFQIGAPERLDKLRTRLAGTLENLHESRSSFLDFVEKNSAIKRIGNLDQMSLDNLRREFDDLKDELPYLSSLANYVVAEKSGRSSGAILLFNLLHDENSLEVAPSEGAFHLWESWDLIKVLGEPEFLGVSADPDWLISKIQTWDQKTREEYRWSIKSRLLNIDPPGGAGGTAGKKTGMQLIWHEAQKSKRHIPVRTMMQRAGEAVLALKPCVMMSPLAVANFLPANGPPFDVVVMDEASQMRTEDALGAILRSKQTIVVGDPKQLPPTSFFWETGDDSSDDAEDEFQLGDLKSVLDFASTCFPKRRRLLWHYRSKHESLISFSNQYFYDNDLHVFPCGEPDRTAFGIELVPCDGVYAAGLNSVEVQEAVAKALSVSRQHPDWSIGLVAVNKKQAVELESEIDGLRERDPVFAEYCKRMEKRNEAIFCKNLENVQGDERDCIIISTVYGRDASGNFYQRFGPISGGYGPRRLNVLFTRAKKRLLLVTSMKSSDIKSDSISNGGAIVLKEYLNYCETKVLAPITKGTEREGFDSPFEEMVASMLSRNGFEVISQKQVAGYFVDLAVRDTTVVDGFLYGIECDGAAYHSRKSARDRDLLRLKVLESLGWKIHRIWSTDWFANPKEESEALLVKLRREADLRKKVQRVS